MYLAPPQGVTPSEFREDVLLDADKTRMIGLPYNETNYDNMFSRFDTIPTCYGQTVGQTDGQNCYQYRASAH